MNSQDFFSFFIFRYFRELIHVMVKEITSYDAKYPVHSFIFQLTKVDVMPAQAPAANLPITESSPCFPRKSV